VTSREFKQRLARRARRSHAALESEWLEPLERYFRLLARWNEKINLTALPLGNATTDETIDRLLVEPLAAARYVADRPECWFDLGSGGGSPAIPLKISRPSLRLTMVEAKTRKAVFLSEAVRLLRLGHTTVTNKRFVDLSERDAGFGSCGLVTIRAVRADRQLGSLAAAALRDGGQLLLFQAEPKRISWDGFRYEESPVLTEAPRTYLARLARVFHVEQRA